MLFDGFTFSLVVVIALRVRRIGLAVRRHVGAALGDGGSVYRVDGRRRGDNKLHAWDAATGAVVFNGGADSFSAVRQFTSPIAVKGRIIVAGDNKVFAFKPQ